MISIRLFVAAVILYIFSLNIVSCKKDSEPAPPPPPTDSLGTGWQKINVPGASNFTDIFFVNAQKGFVCGGSYLGKSADGGLTWTPITLPGGVSELTNIFFLDNTLGWVVSTTAVFRTIDGGDNWTRIPGFSKAIDVQFLNPRLGYLTYGGGLMKSIDSGKTWNPTAGNVGGELNGLYFIDSLNGWVTNTIGKVFKTSNAGNSFTEQKTVGGSPYIVQFTDANHGWVAGNGIWKTVNGGTQWDLALPTQAGGDVQFFNQDRGFIMDGQHIYKTINAAAAIVQLVRLGTFRIVEIHFIDEQHGWACGSDGNILRFVQ